MHRCKWSSNGPTRIKRKWTGERGTESRVLRTELRRRERTYWTCRKVPSPTHDSSVDGHKFPDIQNSTMCSIFFDQRSKGIPWHSGLTLITWTFTNHLTFSDKIVPRNQRLCLDSRIRFFVWKITSWVPWFLFFLYLQHVLGPNEITPSTRDCLTEREIQRK